MKKGGDALFHYRKRQFQAVVAWLFHAWFDMIGKRKKMESGREQEDVSLAFNCQCPAGGWKKRI